MLRLLNAFSLNMLVVFPASVSVEEVSLDEAKSLVSAGFESGVGHADTANVFASQLGVAVPAARATITLKQGEMVLVGQYRGPRLPEGARALPDGATIQWLRVTVI
jgi:hypothetical protein